MTNQYGRRPPKRRLTEAQLKARVAELQAMAVEVVARPGFASFQAANPVTAALWTALARREQQSIEEAKASTQPPSSD